MIEYLNWDSDFFGWKTGLIIVDNSNQIELFLRQANAEAYRLIYVFGNQDFYINAAITDQYNGQLVDRKVLFGLDLNQSSINSSSKVMEYTDQKLNQSLIQLAFESGKYSRFKIDNHFRNHEFERMYTSWILQSVEKQNADYVYVTKDNDCISGMVTLKIKNDMAHIGLISTAIGYQGKGLGRQLVNRCITTAKERNCKFLYVPTQFENIQACKFYEAVGFNQISIQNIYHFWL